MSAVQATLAPIDKDLLDWLFSSSADSCRRLAGLRILDQLAGEEDKGPIVYVAFGSIVRPSKDPGQWRLHGFFGFAKFMDTEVPHMSIRKFQAFLNVQTLLCQ